MVNFGPLAAEIGPVIWGTSANFNWFRVLAALLHGTRVVGVSQSALDSGCHLYLEGGHHVGHWPTFLVFVLSLMYLYVFEGDYDSSNYSQGGPGYNSQAGSHGSGAYVSYGSGSRGPSRGGTTFNAVTSVPLDVVAVIEQQL